MSFLKKLGFVVLKIIGIWTGLAPIIQGALPQGALAATIEDKLGKLFNLIVSVEQTFTAAFGPNAKTGSDKLRAAQPFVAQLIQQTDLLIGKKPKDEALFQTATAQLTGALADILNSYGE
jgi:hypothetical protein